MEGKIDARKTGCCFMSDNYLDGVKACTVFRVASLSSLFAGIISAIALDWQAVFWFVLSVWCHLNTSYKRKQ